VIFCTSFLACDLIVKHCGSEKANRAVYLSFFIQLFFLANILLTLGHSPIDHDKYPDFKVSSTTIEQNVQAITTVFLPMPRMFLASCFSYMSALLSEIFLARALSKVQFIKSDLLKKNISLLISAVVIDTAVFNTVTLLILSSEIMSLSTLVEVYFVTIITKIVLNFGNSLFFKLDEMIEK
jgi:uncharacterized integral membrane protein (TIGR00697 family)